MRKYTKPELETLCVYSKEVIATGLDEWLYSADGEPYRDAGISTYVLVS